MNLAKIKCMNIHEEIKILLVKECKSMARVLRELREKGIKMPLSNNISSKFRNGTIRFSEVFNILDHLGYKITITKK